MLTLVKNLRYAILLCDDIEGMKAFYKGLFAFPIDSESETTLTFQSGATLLSLRQRTRYYDGQGTRAHLPGAQMAFLVERHEVDICHQQLVEMGVTIVDPPTDQPRGHRTVYFTDPEGNLLEIYAEV
ncbi:MAG: VOC family protein [Caldilineaceae bacterium]